MKSMRVVSILFLACIAVITSGCLNTGNVKIGVIVPKEGSMQSYGYQIESGIKMAHEELQALVGQDIEYVTNEGTDDEERVTHEMKNYTLIFKTENENDTESIIAAYNELKAEGVSAIIGPTSSAGVLALTPLANADDIVLLSPSASSPEINEEGGDHIFRNYPSDTLEAQKLASAIFNSMAVRHLLMVRTRTTFAEGISNQMLRFGRQNSKQIPNYVVKIPATPAPEDVTAAVDQIVAESPQAIFLGAYTKELSMLIKEIRTREELSDLLMFTGSAFIPEDADLTKEEMEGLMFTAYAWNPAGENDEAREWSKKFRETYHVQPQIYAATAYDSVQVLVQVINGVNQKVEEEVKNGMNRAIYVSPLLGETNFNKRGDLTRIPIIYVMRDGVKVPLSQEEMNEIKNKTLLEG